MFDFKLLDTFYEVDIILEYPDYRHTTYHCREHLIARYNKEKDIYSFRIDGRENILINNESPVEVMDMLMVEIGNYLYPVCFEVSSRGEILQVENYEEIKRNWFRKVQKLLDNHYTPHFRQYLKIASRNLKNELKLREALVRNSFVKLVLKPLDDISFSFSFKGFPLKGMTFDYLCRVKHRNKINGIVSYYEAKLNSFSEYQGEGYIKYTFSELNDIEEIDARFDLIDAKEQKWVKRISIKTDKKERSVSHKKSFWNRMFE